MSTLSASSDWESPAEARKTLITVPTVIFLQPVLEHGDKSDEGFNQQLSEFSD